jgi:hypothetical protein
MNGYRACWPIWYEGTALFGSDRMNGGQAAFGTSYVQLAGAEVDVVPPQGNQLTGTQPNGDRQAR